MSTTPTPGSGPTDIPVLLLKTISTPTDAYQNLFSGSGSHASDPRPYPFVPEFVPVLQHIFDQVGTTTLAEHLHEGRVGAEEGCRFGGMIFTSQRAVEAFAHVLAEGRKEHGLSWPAGLANIPFYSVGPATTRALTAAALPGPSFSIYGSETGNGDALSKYILSHYRTTYYPSRATLPALLFCVGEVRRDIIPKTLMNPLLPSDQRIEVDELVVYGTGEMPTFVEDLRGRLAGHKDTKVKMVWAVVFSPTGCGGLLKEVGLLGDDGKAVDGRRDGWMRVATIGPTTRAHLVDKYGFEPEVCAAKPSPEGIYNGIVEYMKKNSL